MKEDNTFTFFATLTSLIVVVIILDMFNLITRGELFKPFVFLIYPVGSVFFYLILIKISNKL